MDQSNMNPVERSLYIGNRGIGALEYEQGKNITTVRQSIDLIELSKTSNKIIQRKYTLEDNLQNPSALSNILTIGSSAGGAQAKILVARAKDDKLLAGDIIHDRPVGYYIMKLKHEQENIWYREKNYVEYINNEIAREAGIQVAESKLILEDGRAHFASKHFDRVGNKKVHKQTVNALPGFWRKSLEFGYSDIFKMIESLQLPYRNDEQLFTQMVFNIAASNRDDHTKNFSFLMTEEGEWSLSPAYDLTFPRDPHGTFASAHQIHINGKTKDIRREDVVAVADLVGIRNYNHIINRVTHHVSTFSEKIKNYRLNSNTTRLI